jgi:acetolactate synthase-1/2/3 large subunit
MKKTISNFVVELIYELGSKTVFTLTGGMSMFINNAVAKHRNLRAVYCQHEQACVSSAEGYAKASNFTKAGFAVVTAGPGVSNTLTALISAYGDSTPLIVVAGQIKSKDIDTFGTRTHGIQEINSKAVITPVVKKFTRLSKKNFKKELVETISDAFKKRPGPVFIEIPLDIQAIEIDYKFKDIIKIKNIINKNISLNKNYNENKIHKALQKLLKSERPLLYIGNGVRIAGAENEILAFAKFHNIPCVFSWPSSDVSTISDPLNFGCPGPLASIYSNQILFEADLIIFLGARLDLLTTGFQRKEFGAQAKRFFIDVDNNELLKFKNFKKTTIINYDLRFIKELIKDYLNKKFLKKVNWLNESLRKKDQYLKREFTKLYNPKKINVYNLSRILSKISSNKIFIPTSSGYAIETFLRFFKPKKKTRVFIGAALGAMGTGLPFAIGASCFTNKQIVCLEADGGLMLNIQELATLKYLKPKKFILIILNNRGYESIRVSQGRHFNHIAGSDINSGLYLPNYQKIAKAFNLKYKKINNVKKMHLISNIIHNSIEPIIIDIFLDQGEYRGPSGKTIVSKSGKISSTSLKKIDW